MKVTNQIRSKVLTSAWKSYNSQTHKTIGKFGYKTFAKYLKETWEFYKSKNYFQKTETNYVAVGHIAKQSEKAIAYNVQLECVHTHQVVNKLVWFPKSLTLDGKVASWFLAKKEDELISRQSINLTWL